MAITVSLARAGRPKAWLARECGWSHQRLYSRLDGTTEMTVADLGTIAAALGMTATTLLELADAEQRAAS